MRITERRKKYLGNGSTYFYQKPLHTVKGEDVWLFDDIQTQYSYNETQLRVMANSDYFITVCGGNSILSSLFGTTVISYVHKGKELRPNYFGKNSYFRKLSNANVIPVYDVIGKVNLDGTYDHKINNTGKNDYSELISKIKETIIGDK